MGQLPDRRLNWEACFNVRDVGGYATQGGRTRWGWTRAAGRNKVGPCWVMGEGAGQGGGKGWLANAQRRRPQRKGSEDQSQVHSTVHDGEHTIVLSFWKKGGMMPIEAPRGTLPRRQRMEGACSMVLEGQSVLSSQG